jgi:hypothetical protein
LPALGLAGLVGDEEARALSSGPEFGIDEIKDTDTGIKFGDIEVGFSLQPFNSFRRRPGEPRARVPLRARFDALYRFPTGSPPRPWLLTEVGAGDGQGDVELRATFDAGYGSKFWVSLFGGYNIQLEGTVERLVTSPSAPIQLGAYVSEVNWNPGDILTFVVAPRFNFTRTITFSGLFMVEHHGRDQVTAAEALPLDPAFQPGDLEEGTEYSARSLGFTARYSSTDWAGDRRQGMPIEVELRYLNTRAASAGIAPDFNVWQVSARYYLRVLGR